MKKQSKTNWERIDALTDEDIDYADSPRLTPEFFQNAIRWPGKKELISLRVDPDVLAFLRKQGKGYQTTINILLRKYMESQTGKASGNLSTTVRAGSRRLSVKAARKK